MRRYFLEDPLHPQGGISIGVRRDDDCVFCEHCTDLWWDYTNLIYMTACDLGVERPSILKPCRSFKESEPQTDEEYINNLLWTEAGNGEQTEIEIARAIVHKAIDDTPIAEDEYPDLRQKMHDAVDNYEPQTDCAWKGGCDEDNSR